MAVYSNWATTAALLSLSFFSLYVNVYYSILIFNHQLPIPGASASAAAPEFEIFFGLAVVAFDVFIDGETDPAKFHFRLNFCRLLRSIEEMIVLLKLNCSCYWNYKRRKINEKEATNILINAALVSIAKTAKTFEPAKGPFYRLGHRARSSTALK